MAASDLVTAGASLPLGLRGCGVPPLPSSSELPLSSPSSPPSPPSSPDGAAMSMAVLMPQPTSLTSFFSAPSLSPFS